MDIWKEKNDTSQLYMYDLPYGFINFNKGEGLVSKDRKSCSKMACARRTTALWTGLFAEPVSQLSAGTCFTS